MMILDGFVALSITFHIAHSHLSYCYYENIDQCSFNMSTLCSRFVGGGSKADIFHNQELNCKSDRWV